MNRLCWMAIACMLFGLASPTTVFAVGKGTPSFYDRHVFFDNSHSDTGLVSSSGWAIAPSTLELANRTVPVDTQHFVSPPNALRTAGRFRPQESKPDGLSR